MAAAKDMLILGYGNPGRQDDGIGPEFIRRLSLLNLPAVSMDSNYQLSVENAYDMADKSIVIFVDASINDEAPFVFKKVEKAHSDGLSSHGLSSHDVSPEALVHLACILYKASPDSYILAIRGYDFDRFEEKLSAQAELNLLSALDFLSDWIDRQSAKAVQHA